MGWYLLVLTSAYFCQTVYCLTNLRFIDFAVTFPNPAYAEEMYYYSLAIEKMKIIHCTALFCICIFLVRMTAKYQLLTEKHYIQMLVLAAFVTMLFIIPVIYIAFISYIDAG